MITLKKLEEAVSIRRQMEALEKRFASLLGAPALGLTNRTSRRGVSAATRAKLSAAAKARWAKKKGGRAVTVSKVAKREGGLTPAGRKKLSQLMKARWAARKKAAGKK